MNINDVSWNSWYTYTCFLFGAPYVRDRRQDGLSSLADLLFEDKIQIPACNRLGQAHSNRTRPIIYVICCLVPDLSRS